MENASKALIMAAGVLIGIILLSLMVYMFTNFAITSAEVHKENEQNQLNQFNSQFTSYEGKEGLTIYDVVTVANLATENNIYYEHPQQQGINNTSKDNSYISVILKNPKLIGYNNKHIEKGYEDTRNDTYKQQIAKYYNTLIKTALDDVVEKQDDPPNGPTYKGLREYSCNVEISEITGRVYLIEFTAKQ